MQRNHKNTHLQTSADVNWLEEDLKSVESKILRQAINTDDKYTKVES